MPSVYDPITAGAIEAKNRVWMAPLTRARGTKDFLPTPLHAEYYSQRAGAGLIISEATPISLQGAGWPRVPGIWNEKQIEAWKDTTKAVHDKGGKIVLQLWHMGRNCHSKVNGLEPVAPSPVPLSFPVHTYEGKLPPEVPHELTKDEIKSIVGDYAQAAKNALAAGFDGVEIHGANGYLIDEFLKTSSNKRTDEYGGSPENRVRFLREVVEAVTAAVGSEKTGIRVSLNTNTFDAGYADGDTKNAEADARLAAKIFQEFKLAFVEIREPPATTTFGPPPTIPPMHKVVREEYKGILVLNSDLHAKESEDHVASGESDAVAIGRPFISNPDLVERFKNKWPLAEAPVSAWYIDGHPDYDSVPKEKGYTDWPPYKA